MNEAPLLIANLGAEEGAPLRPSGPVESAARLWRSLFGPDPAFEWLARDEAAWAWLNTEAAAREAAAAGRTLAGAAPEVVRRVHDKAFAHEAARREGLVPACLDELAAVLGPEELLPEEAGVRALDARLRAWPDWARRRFTLKPRLGSSGRGRVAGADGRADTAEIRGALTRLAARGGVVLEPWLERVEDLSAQLHVDPDGSIRLLGTTRLLVDPSGLYRGHSGRVATRGRIASDSRHDEPLREAAVSVARAAAEAGYRGPCGVDAFSFLAPEGNLTLRPVVEFNARFTLGMLAIALVRRSMPSLRKALGLRPDSPRFFCFALAAPDGGWPAPGPDLRLLPLEPSGPPAGPALLFARTPEALAAALGTAPRA